MKPKESDFRTHKSIFYRIPRRFFMCHLFEIGRWISLDPSRKLTASFLEIPEEKECHRERCKLGWSRPGPKTSDFALQSPRNKLYNQEWIYIYTYVWIACLELPPTATSLYQAATKATRLQPWANCTLGSQLTVIWWVWVAQPSGDHCRKDTLLRSWRSGEHSRAPGGLIRQPAGNIRIIESQYLAGENCVVSCTFFHGPFFGNGVVNRVPHIPPNPMV